MKVANVLPLQRLSGLYAVETVIMPSFLPPSLCALSLKDAGNRDRDRDRILIGPWVEVEEVIEADWL